MKMKKKMDEKMNKRIFKFLKRKKIKKIQNESNEKKNEDRRKKNQ